MGTPTWVLPVASLTGICFFALIFIWWWFPRTWKKGTEKEMEIMAAQRRERERYMQQRNLESGETSNATQKPTELQQLPKAAVHTPPAYTSY